MVILTGGAGFIGSCFLWKLNQQGIYDVIVVDELGTGNKWKNLLGKKFLDFVPKDELWDFLKDRKAKEIKKIVHLGACTSTTLEDADYFIKNNYQYSQRLAIWALAQRVHFIYASSAATYGDGSLGYDDNEEVIAYLRPLNIYGYSKNLFDLWVLNNDLFKKFLGIKFFNVFGPNEYHKKEMSSLICQRFNEIVEGKSFRLFKSYHPQYKDGEQKRDFIYIKDVVEVMYYFYERPHLTGIYNLGTGKAHSWNELAYALFSALGLEPKIEYIEMPKELRAQYQYFTEAKIDKLRKAGYRKEFMSLEEAVCDYVPYLKENSYL